MGEPAQFKRRLQFERAHPLVRTNTRLSLKYKGFGVMGKLVRIVMGVFQAQNSHVKAKRCYRSKISKGELIKVMIGKLE
jgi:hypothetical protein